MTTQVVIKNLGPDAVRVEAVDPSGEHVNQTLHVLPGCESGEHQLYVHDSQVVRVIEDKDVAPSSGA